MQLHATKQACNSMYMGSVSLCDMIIDSSDEGIMISLRVQRSTKNSYLLSWHKSQGLGFPISLKIMLA